MKNEILIYPNPTSGNISVKNPYVGDRGSYEVIDFTGKVWVSGKIDQYDSLIAIELDNVVTGTYILKLTRTKDGHVETIRFVNQK